MADEAYATRRELDQLRELVRDNGTRLDSIDVGGTRGVAVLQLQISDLAKNFAAHEKQHELDEARRVSGRRWLAGAFIALIASIDGPLVTILLSRR